MDYPIPDARGDVLRGGACRAGGPAAHFATLPLRAILAALTAEGIPAYLSYTAGTYLCNYTLYTTLHAIAERAARHPGPASSTCRSCPRWSPPTGWRSRAWTWASCFARWRSPSA